MDGWLQALDLIHHLTFTHPMMCNLSIWFLAHSGRSSGLLEQEKETIISAYVFCDPDFIHSLEFLFSCFGGFSTLSLGNVACTFRFSFAGHPLSNMSLAEFLLKAKPRWLLHGSVSAARGIQAMSPHSNEQVWMMPGIPFDFSRYFSLKEIQKWSWISGQGLHPLAYKH